MTRDQSQAELDQRTLKFTVQSTGNLREGDALIIRRISSRPDGVRIEAVPEKTVREVAAKLLT